MRKLFATLVMVVALTAVMPEARAWQKKPDAATAKAKEAFDKAEIEFQLGHYNEALAAYEEAFRAKPLPEFLFNIGQCHKYLGNWDSALRSYRTYLGRSPNAPNRATVEKYIAEMEAKTKTPTPPGETAPPGGVAVPPPVVVGPGGAPMSAGGNPPAPAPSPTPDPGAPPPSYGAPPPGYAPQPAYPPAGQQPAGQLVAGPPPAQDEPITHKWWFWGAIGVVVVTAVVVGVVASSSGGASTPSGSLGTVDLR